ncbi:BnaAnng18120D, partial [Brassica napus]
LLLKKVKPAQIVNLLPSVLPITPRNGTILFLLTVEQISPLQLHAQCIKRDTANYLSETCQIFSSLEKGEASS